MTRAVLLACLFAVGLSLGATVTVTIDYSVDNGTFTSKMSGHTGHVDADPYKPIATYLETNTGVLTWRDDNINARQYAAGSSGDYYTMAVDPTLYTEPWGTDKTNWEAYCVTKAFNIIDDGYADIQWDLINEANNMSMFKEKRCSDSWATTCTQDSDCYGTEPHDEWCRNLLKTDELADTIRFCYEAMDGEYGATAMYSGGPGTSTDLFWLSELFFKGDDDTTGGEKSVADSTYYNEAYLMYAPAFGMLEYMNTHAATFQYDFLSFHLFTDDRVMEWSEWIEILREAIIAEIDDYSLSNLETQWGSTLANLPIMITEMFHKDHDDAGNYWNWLDPGHIVVGIGELHEAGVAAGTRACWDDPEEDPIKSSCSEKTLSGLLRYDADGNPQDRRAAWWVYDYYADIADATTVEAEVTSGYARVHGVAADSAANDEYYALLGFTTRDKSGTYTTDAYDVLQIDMDGLGADCCGASVAIKHLRPTDFVSIFAESDLIKNSTSTVCVSGGTATVLVSDWIESDVVYVVVDTTDCGLGTNLTGGALTGGSIQ